MKSNRTHSSRQRTQRGAAAVEFALVSVLLFPLLLGVVDYGLWFNDSLNTRQGVREGARLGVVQTSTCSGSSPSAGLQTMACAATKQVAPSAGQVWAKVLVPNGWQKRKAVIVCAMVQETGVTGFVPLPSDRIIRSKTQMSIEVDDPLPGGATASGSGSAVWPTTAAPASWTWCA